MSNAILTEKIGQAFIICFNRPEIRSPLTIAVLEELHGLMDALADDKEFTQVIFTGVNDVFASGADLREIAKVNSSNAREYAERGQSLMKKITELPQETIAFVNGFCFGGALDLALSCDKRIATPNAIFCHPGANLGIMTGWGGTQRLPRLIGEAKALEMFLTAKQVKADEAESIGLIDRIDPEFLQKRHRK